MSTPQGEMDAAFSARIDGTMTQDAYIATVERVSPLLSQAPVTAPTADEARKAVDDLRQRRVDGKVTELDFSNQMDRLAPLAQPALSANSEQQQYDALMAPAASPYEYRIDYANGAPSTPEEVEHDAAIRGAMKDMGIPGHLGGPIVDAIDRLATRFEDATEADRQSHVHQFRAALQERWGAEYQAKSDKLSALLLDAAAKHPTFAVLLDEMPYALADIGVSEWLLSVAEHKSRVAAL